MFLYNWPVTKNSQRLWGIITCIPSTHSFKWLTELKFYIPFDTKQVISQMFPKPIFWLGMEKLDLTQQKHAFTNQKKCTTKK